MSTHVLTAKPSEVVYEKSLRAQHAAWDRLESAKARFDRAIVRYDAWFLVFTAVILGLGASILAGMAVWCVVKQNKRFTGEWSFKDFGLKVRMECK